MGDNELRALLIEDNKDQTFIVEKILKVSKKAAFSVEIADTLAKGLELLAKNNIDVILLDLTLPDSIGLDTFARVHAHAPKVPIVIMTGADDDTQAKTALSKGAQDYLVKGFSQHHVLALTLYRRN